MIPSPSESVKYEHGARLADAPVNGHAGGNNGNGNGNGTVALPARGKEYDNVLRQRLLDYSKQHAFSNTELGRKLGYADGTAVSKYLSGKPEGDVLGFERRIADMLKNADRQVARPMVTLFETSVTRKLEVFAESLRRMGGIGALSGPAGHGKTCAAKLYAMGHPTVISLRVNQWDRECAGQQGLLFDALDNSGCPGNASRVGWMIERLRGSKRLLLLDNAQRMFLAALRWWFDFSAVTGCPLLLVGDETLLPTLRVDRELSSLVRVKADLGLKTAADQQAAVTALLGDEASPELLDLGVQVVAAQHGNLRALTHQLALTRDILADDKFKGGESGAFLAAGPQMLRDAQLALADTKGGR